MSLLHKMAFKLLQGYRSVKLRKLGTAPVWTKLDKGFWMKIDPNNDMDKGFYFGNYERALSNFISKFVQAGDVCFDIGTHKGYFTLQLAKQVTSVGKVYSFDPDPNAFRILKENCDHNKFTHVVLNHLALADKKGTCEFFLNNYLGHSSRFPNEYAAANVMSKVIVETTTLDDYIAEHNITPAKHKVSFVKIDAEGSELLIISAMEKTIMEFSPVIHMEVNYLSLKAANASPDAIDSYLRKHEYSLFIIDFKRSALGQVQFLFEEISDLKNRKNHDMIDIIAIKKNSEYWQRFQVIR